MCSYIVNLHLPLKMFRILSDLGFCPFGILSNSVFCPFGILSDSGFWPSRDFVLRDYIPPLSFVIFIALYPEIRFLSQNMVPFLVVATSGSTVLGAYDPINPIADICQKYDLWLHVDVSCYVL